MDWVQFWTATFKGMMDFYGIAWIFAFVFFGFAVLFFVKWMRAVDRENNCKTWIKERMEDLDVLLDNLEEYINVITRKH